MNLQEQISRIKSMMRIFETMDLNESALNKLKRNLDKLPMYIKSTCSWLNPKAFNSFEEFLQRVIFSSTRDFISNEYDFNSEKELEEIRVQLLYYVKLYVEENMLEEILYYYNQR